MLVLRNEPDSIDYNILVFLEHDEPENGDQFKANIQSKW
jgi:hypothetical protein